MGSIVKYYLGSKLEKTYVLRAFFVHGGGAERSGVEMNVDDFLS
jgi:hypothetical protein